VFYNFVIGLMGSDPEPFYGIIFEDSQGTPMQADPDRVDRNAPTDSDFLEIKTGMGRVARPDAIDVSGFQLHSFRQVIEELPKPAGDS
jgi:hypothetical protein